ncbi:hypothetical protein F0L68_02090 [Solihabitans fulvus]|uniref:Secreted protein n=1 Tax=Solihabitans fulvus TaxID=1892852 RepID=A0A5B2XUB3_9PSEU|nr:hypothetical protein [Solihabitans fulvus]KAA2266550.1 hypothetical protein F0L68_02090 [Solihabitans fulvus]
MRRALTALAALAMLAVPAVTMAGTAQASGQIFGSGGGCRALYDDGSGHQFQPSISWDGANVVSHTNGNYNCSDGYRTTDGWNVYGATLSLLKYNSSNGNWDNVEQQGCNDVSGHGNTHVWCNNAFSWHGYGYYIMDITAYEDTGGSWHPTDIESPQMYVYYQCCIN